MRTEIRPIVLALALALGTVMPADDARACGPDFPEELLSQRTSTLLELQDGMFLTEAGKLVPAPAVQFTVPADEPDGVRTRGTLTERALYELGAEAFHGGDFATAERAFASLLALPPGLRRDRSTWAAYMLGRIRVRGAKAIAAYQQVRALATEGFVDELGLAAASLGAEARIHLDAGDVVAAVHLYAEQAALGHPDGATSLLLVVRAQTKHVGRANALIADPVGQRLLAAYLFTRAGEMSETERALLWRRLAAQPSVAGADHLAAAAYREGKWELAGRLARQDDTATLSRRVLAKLALRDGDEATAERLLEQVEAAMTAERGACAADESDAVGMTIARVQGELAILALSGGRPSEAMARAWEARVTYPVDAIYIAERILTIDELRSFVDALPADAPSAPTDAAEADEPYDDEWTATPSTMRLLLARRLLRAGRFADAAPYFTPRLRDIAHRFTRALERGRRGGDRIERAGGLYEASALARKHGLEIFGTEVGPDWAIYGAAYDPRAFDIEYDDEGNHARVDRTDRSRTSAFEVGRVTASAPPYPQRYHYRYLASALAEQAADLLPHQSQAFAATLCHAARYVQYVDEERFHALYHRYTFLGPRVDFSSSFGQSCPEPELDRARRFLPHPPTPPTVGLPPSRNASRVLLAIALVLCALGISWTSRRLARAIWP